jgi:hypothetical protein
MLSKNYDPDNDTRDPTTPEGVGNNAGYAVLEGRQNDGSNQQLGPAPVTGELSAVYPSGSSTPYQPVNSWETLNDPWRWQPMCVPLVPYGTPCNSPSKVQGALTPQWRTVRSFALNPTTHYPPQFVLPGPPKLKSGAFDPKDIDSEAPGQFQPQRPPTGQGRVLGRRARDGVPTRPYGIVRPGPVAYARQHPSTRTSSCSLASATR